CLDESMVDLAFIDRMLKAVDDGVEADAPFNGLPGVGPKFLQQGGPVVLQKSIYNFIGVAHKTVDAVNMVAVLLVEQPYAQRKGGAVKTGGADAAFQIVFAVEVHGFWL